MGAASSCPCFAGTEAQRFSLTFRNKHQDKVSGSVRRELRRAGTPQRVESLLRLYEVRGMRRSIEDFYEPIKLLGEGAYGSVVRYRSRQEKGRTEEVAVKHIAWGTVWHGFWRCPEKEEMVRRELKTMMVLDNPFIIRVREWFEDPRRGIYFVMEVCDGGSLQDLLDEVCTVPSRTIRHECHYNRLRRHFREMAYALQYLHAMQPPIVHCDLKPDNALLKTKEPSSCIKLIDFGLVSLLTAEEEEAKWTQGTLLFMAPEQFLQATGKFTTEMDVWALGVIFAWIITAVEKGSLQHPALEEAEGKGFDPNFLDLNSAYRAMPENGPTLRRELFGQAPASAIDLADKMLVNPPLQRWTTAQISQHDWTVDGDTACAGLLTQESVIMNMRMYPQLDKFERALLNLVAGRVSAHVGEARDIVASLRSTFMSLDTSCDGALSKEELIAGLKSTAYGIRGPEGEAALEAEVSNLFDELGQTSTSCFDLDTMDGQGDEESMLCKQESSGSQAGLTCPKTPGSENGEGLYKRKKNTLSYTEWLAATIGCNVLSSEDALSSAFHELDASLKGVVTRADLAGAVGEDAADRILLELGGAEHVSYEDFKKLARKVAIKRWGITPYIKDASDSDSSSPEIGRHAKRRMSLMTPVNATMEALRKNGRSGVRRKTLSHLPSSEKVRERPFNVP